MNNYFRGFSTEKSSRNTALGHDNKNVWSCVDCFYD